MAIKKGSSIIESSKIQGGTSVKILAQSTDGVDILVGAILGECPNAAARKLEELDAKLFCELANETWSGKRRFVTVKRDWRTILTLAGAVTFRRRYYLDRSTGRYTHPPDAAMGLCRYSRASADVRLKMLDMAGECPYRYVGANAVPGQALSKSTVCRVIRDTAVTTTMGKMGPGKGAAHVQIDEKYISMIGKKHKSRYITATIYAGKKAAGGRNALTNRTLISGVEVADVAAKINAALSEAYGLNADSSVYLSGDLAGYIQSFPERLMCKATYVPDKWHVCRFLSSKGSPVKAEDVLKKLESIDETGDMAGLSEDAAKVYRLWKGNPQDLRSVGEGRLPRLLPGGHELPLLRPAVRQIRQQIQKGDRRDALDGPRGQGERLGTEDIVQVTA